ncbi:keratin, type II cytoskeletal 4-like [Chelydra serpentina]|uniref:Keratin, type II cytoskeletal 4-like n=1 Tax=Chelydra serpentina TaxID=8475 RepID=A0A8T1SDV1_CHESE|nr:keratin, type II cytoskeletal 4-like [Chelydra serpentina]
MKRQTFFASSTVGRKGFSSASDVCGLNGHRTCVASVGPPVERCGVGGYSSRSVCHLGGSTRIADAVGCPSGAGCYGGYGYGGTGWGSVGYGSSGGLSGRVGLCGPRGYGTFGGYADCRSDGIRGVSIDESLLKPLCVGVDPQEQQAREHEREQMKTLNNQFACFIDKVRHLEQQNKVLETKWNLLQQCVPPAPQKNLEQCFENYICSLRKQLEDLLSDKEQLACEESASRKLVDEFKCKYEEEISRRTAAETEFVLLKKDADCALLHKEELEVNTTLLKQKLEFLRCMFDEERAQMDGRFCDTAVVVKMDNSRDLDTDCIIKNVEGWYQEIAQKSKEEVDVLYQTRFQELQDKRGRFSEDLERNKHEIAELTRLIQKLQGEADHVKKQIACLQTAVCDAEQRGDCALKDARGKHVEMQNALQKAKDELACMLRDYQALLNVKLALDIEITTYKKLLEGEESRICLGTPVSVSVVSNSSNIAGDYGTAVGVGSGCGYGSLSRGYSSGHGRCGSLGGGFSSKSLGVCPRSVVSVAGSQNIPEGADCYPPGGFSSRSGSCISRGVVSSVCSHHLPGGVHWCPPGGVVSGGGGYNSKVVTSSVGTGQVSGGVACCPDGGYITSSGYPGNGVCTFETGGFIIQYLGSSPAGGPSTGAVDHSGAGSCNAGVPGSCEVVRETGIAP